MHSRMPKWVYTTTASKESLDLYSLWWLSWNLQIPNILSIPCTLVSNDEGTPPPDNASVASDSFNRKAGPQHSSSGESSLSDGGIGGGEDGTSTSGVLTSLAQFDVLRFKNSFLEVKLHVHTWKSSTGFVVLTTRKEDDLYFRWVSFGGNAPLLLESYPLGARQLICKCIIQLALQRSFNIHNLLLYSRICL